MTPSPSFNFKILENGNLRISLSDPSEKDEVVEMLEKHGSNWTFVELSESYWTNSWWVGTADQLLQMSECLIICEEGYIEDDGKITFHGRAWTNFNNYMVTCPIDEILENGFVDFPLWEKFEMETFNTLSSIQ